MVVRAVWGTTVIAEADDGDVKVAEGNVYFSLETVNRDLLVESPRHSQCYWKGQASCYHLDVQGIQVPDAAWRGSVSLTSTGENPSNAWVCCPQTPATVRWQARLGAATMLKRKDGGWIGDLRTAAGSLGTIQ